MTKFKNLNFAKTKKKCGKTEKFQIVTKLKNHIVTKLKKKMKKTEKLKL